MAKTTAERQADYRARRNDGEGDRRLNTWVSTSSNSALERLVCHHNLTKKELLEKLITSADDDLQKTIEPGSDEWNIYMNKLRSNSAEQKQSNPNLSFSTDISSDEPDIYKATDATPGNYLSYAVTRQDKDEARCYAVTLPKQLQLF